MKYTFLLVFLISGCITVPVIRHMPQLPPSLNIPCQELVQLPRDTAKLSGILKSVTINYGLYHECAIKLEMFQSWYKEQIEIFDSVK